MGQLSSNGCEQMRGYVSASLDGELSQVERVRLETHLAACAGCRAYAADVAGTSRLLRETALEELEFPIVLPSRRLAMAGWLQVTAVAAGVAVVVGLSAVVGTTGDRVRTNVRPAPAAAKSVALQFPEQELKMLHRASLRIQRRNVHSPQTL